MKLGGFRKNSEVMKLDLGSGDGRWSFCFLFIFQTKIAAMSIYTPQKGRVGTQFCVIVWHQPKPNAPLFSGQIPQEMTSNMWATKKNNSPLYWLGIKAWNHRVLPVLLSLKILAHLLRMVLEPKYLAFRRWLYTSIPQSSSDTVIGSLGFCLASFFSLTHAFGFEPRIARSIQEIPVAMCRMGYLPYLRQRIRRKTRGSSWKR